MAKTRQTGTLPDSEQHTRPSEKNPKSLIFATLLEVLPDLMLHLGTDGVIREVLNPGHPDLLGEAAEVEGTHLARWMDAKPIRQWQEAVRTVWRNGGVFAYEYRLKFPEGLRHFEARIIRSGEDEMLSVIHNITEHNRHTEQQLVQAAKLDSLGEFVAEVSHELNTPLATIQLCGLSIHRLLADSPQASSTHDFLQRIFRQVERASLILKQLQFFSREDDEEQQERFALQQVVEDVLILFEERFRNEGVHLTRQFPKRPLWLHGNPIRVEQVVQNLLSNASDALRHAMRREVVLKGGLRQGQVFLEVQDSGTGVAPEHRKRLFDPFFSTKPTDQGSGLGLSISLGIVTAHGGQLRYTPYSSGGSVFRMELPEALPETP